MKIWDVIREEFEPQPLEEGWKNNVLATVLAVSSMFNSAKAGAPNPTDSVSISQQQLGDSMRLDVSKLFQSGQYLFHPDDEKAVKEELMRLGKEIQKNPTGDFAVQVVSSESQVPNFDGEPESPTYKQRLDTMDLTNKRAQTVNFILKNFTDDLKKKGVLKGNVTFTEPKLLVGKTPWDPKLGKDNQIYKKDQFVVVDIKLGKGHTAQANDPYAAFAEMGEKITFNNHAIGMLFYPSRQTADPSQAGDQDTRYQNVLFKVLKPESELGQGFRGKKSENVYNQSYIIPWEWWNKNVFNSTLTQEQIAYIKSNFKAA